MNHPDQLSSTTVRRLTAPVSSAIATIAIDGPRAAEAARAAIVNASGRPVRLEQSCVRFARWRFTDTQLADEHVVVLMRSPQAIEIHCHGGLAISEQIIEQLQAAGCEVIPSGTHGTSTATGDEESWSPNFEHCVTDEAIENAARLTLQNAMTLKASLLWLDQYRGALAREFAELRRLIAENCRGDAIAKCDALLARGTFGRKLLKPWRLTLAGPPNVGKSSLMNALCGATRVLVHHEAGTTRDAIEANLVIGDWPLVLTDTAGIRESSEVVESLGIETARQRWRAADLGLLVVDATVGWTTQHDDMLVGPETVFVVLNKIDAFEDARQIEQCMAAIRNKLGTSSCTIVMASAKRENGVEEIVRAIALFLDNCRPPLGSGVPFTREQVRWLEHQRRGLL